ncbi:MAG: site-specific integrase [Eubacterium sp.]|nr:site-specific integrase [Eubacterium sp.]
MARLAAGMRIKKDGRFEKRFYIDGKQHTAIGRTQKDCLAHEQKLRAKINAGIYKDNRNITLDQYFAEWIRLKEKTTKGNTLKGYENKYRKHISPILGGRKVQKIERREVQRMQEECTKTLKASTTNNIMIVLKAILHDAVLDEIITKSPADGVKNVKETEKAADTIHRALTEQEQVAFMQEARESYYFGVFALMLNTGMRNGEVCALTWQDVDYKNRVIHINKTVTRTKGGAMDIGTPKSAAGVRDVPLTDAVLEVLKGQRDKMQNIFTINRQDRIFVGSFGGIIQDGTLNAEIDRILQRLEAKGVHIDHFTTHALRDTFATRFIEQGGQPQTLKTILGHSSLAITMDLYAHVLPNTKQEEMNRVHIAM